MVQQLVLFDSSVLINILATGRQQEILAMFQGGAGVCAAVAAETQFLRGEQPTGPRVGQRGLHSQRSGPPLDGPGVRPLRAGSHW